MTRRNSGRGNRPRWPLLVVVIVSLALAGLVLAAVFLQPVTAEIILDYALARPTPAA